MNLTKHGQEAHTTTQPRPGYGARSGARCLSGAAFYDRVDGAGPELLVRLLCSCARGIRAGVCVSVLRAGKCVSYWAAETGAATVKH
jgi:hypothetical protein